MAKLHQKYRYVVLILILSVLLYLFKRVTDEAIANKVIKVSDGDTIIVFDDSTKKETKIRLFGIDTPEKRQPYGKKAQQFTNELCYGKSVKIKAENKDRYGRVVALVYLDDGRVLNEELLKHGFAWHYKQYTKAKKYKEVRKKYSELEKYAKKTELGLWKDKKPIPPWKWRKNEKKYKKRGL